MVDDKRAPCAAMIEYCERVSELLDALCGSDEIYLANFSGEQSHFYRFNHGRLRQPTEVDQLNVNITWIREQKQISHDLSLTGAWAADKDQITHVVKQLQQDLVVLPQDPYLLIATEPQSTDKGGQAEPLDLGALCDDLFQAVSGLDCVGLLTAGQQMIGFANSFGQRNWCRFNDLLLDWSLFLGDGGDKAAKGFYSAEQWDLKAFQRLLEKTRLESELLRRPNKKIERGSYRTYLAPAAVSDLINFLDVGCRATKEKTSLLQRWYDGEASLSEQMTLKQTMALGLAANVQAQGFLQQELTLVDGGQPADQLISPRSAKEYGLAHNGAADHEGANQVELMGGGLSQDRATEVLDTGLYLNNLHYLNISDRASARLTGMTRYACFWVESGEIVAPIDVMRFDDSLYRLFGTALEALTSERERMVDTGSYFKRARGGGVFPGALLSSMAFTL